MVKSEIEKRNLISTITECLKEHKVELSGEMGAVQRYLIEVGVSSSLLNDFIDTYKGEIDNFKRRLAEQVMSKEPSDQIYGVLVDNNLKYDFAFNRNFADLNRKNKKIEFKGIEEILLKMSGKGDLSSIIIPKEKIPPFNPTGQGHETGRDIRRFPRGFPGNTVLKYSLIGKKDVERDVKNNEQVSYDKDSLLGKVRDAYSKNKIELRLGDKILPFFLVNISYKTSTFTDFMRTYLKEVDDFKEKLAKKTFGDKKTNNQYSLLFSPDLQIKFAYNSQFASYNVKSRSIIYTPVEEILLGQIKRQVIDLSEIKIPKKTRVPYRTPRRPGRIGPTVFKYSLQGK